MFERVATLLDSDAPLLVVLTMRDEALTDEAPLEALLAHPRVSALDLEPLSKRDQQAMLVDDLALEPSLAEALGRASAGRLGRHLLEAGAPLRALERLIGAIRSWGACSTGSHSSPACRVG